MRRFAQLIACSLALLIAGQALASVQATVMVCKRTGKVMRSCPCPSEEERPVELRRESCCELRTAGAEPLTGAVAPAGRQLVSVLLAVPPAGVLEAPSVPVATLAPPPQEPAPPAIRLHLRLRQLLI